MESVISLVLNVLAWAAAVYVMFFALGMFMYFLNARQTDQTVYEFKRRREELWFHFVVIPFVIGPILLVLELVLLALGICLAVGSLITTGRLGPKAA